MPVLFMIEVFPISIPTIDWNVFLKETSTVVGRNTGTAMDQAGESKNLKGFILTLANIHYLLQDEIKSLREVRRQVLGHLSFGFLILDPPVLDLMHLNDLSVILHDDKLAIVSGSLATWVLQLGELDYDSLSTDGRIAFNKIFLLFEQLGFRDLWNKYRKLPLNDRTFKLSCQHSS